MAISNIGPSFTLGDRLAKARREAGVSVQAMADIFGVTRNTIYTWEHDTVEVKASVVRDWAEVTGVSPAWFFDFGNGDGRGPHRAPAAGAAVVPVPVERTEEEDTAEAQKVGPPDKSGPTLLVTSSRRNRSKDPCRKQDYSVHHAEPGDKAA